MPEKEKAKTYTLSGNNPFNGAKLGMLTPDIAQQLHLNSTEPRVVVIEGNSVQNNWGMGIETGDVIIAINGKQVHSIEDIEKNLAVKSRQLQISLVRGGTLLNMEVTR
jgi:S1-C subfamily serine protease